MPLLMFSVAQQIKFAGVGIRKPGIDFKFLLEVLAEWKVNSKFSFPGILFLLCIIFVCR